MIKEESEPLPEWDYTWTGANEKAAPTDWVETASGNANGAMSGTYWRITVTSKNGYLQYSWPSTYSKGVLQISFRFNDNYGNARFYLSNGTNAIGVRATYASGGKQALLLNDASVLGDMTEIGSFTVNKTYNLKLVLDNGYADVYWRNYSDDGDWQLVASHVDCSAITGSSPKTLTTIRFTSLANDGVGQHWYLYYVRMKFGRTS